MAKPFDRSKQSENFHWLSQIRQERNLSQRLSPDAMWGAMARHPTLLNSRGCASDEGGFCPLLQFPFVNTVNTTPQQRSGRSWCAGLCSPPADWDWVISRGLSTCSLPTPASQHQHRPTRLAARRLALQSLPLVCGLDCHEDRNSPGGTRAC